MNLIVKTTGSRIWLLFWCISLHCEDETELQSQVESLLVNRDKKIVHFGQKTFLPYPRPFVDQQVSFFIINFIRNMKRNNWGVSIIDFV